jgi:serine/threonine-protein kinase HipA
MPKSEWINKKTTLIILLLKKSCFLKRILFCYVTGKRYAFENFQATKNEKTTLAPIYDFLNSTIAIKIQRRKLLTLKGKSNLKATDFIDYYGKERLQLNENDKYSNK